MIRLAGLVLVMMVSACSTPRPAPVIEHSSDVSGTSREKDGQYRVRRGDTLHAIAFRYRLDHRDIARWNGITMPYLIYPDELLRLTPSPARKALAGTRSSQSAPAQGKTAAPPPAAAGKPPPAKATAKPRNSELGTADPETWIWPLKGRLVRSFLPNDPSRNGLDIAGREGQEVRATAAGTVVYSGNGLIGYGELIIIKHSDRMLSAYAHNRVRLVKEGAQIHSGQKNRRTG